MVRFFTMLIFLLLYYAVSPAAAQKNILIVYHSETGNTERLAQAVAEGAASADGVKVLLKSVSDVSEKDLLNADAIIVGSPVYNANVSPQISAYIASWPFEGEPLKDKIGAAFATAGGISAGEEIVQMNILQSMLVFGMIVVGGPDWTQPFGASAITFEKPFDSGDGDRIAVQFLEKGKALGRRVAELCLLIAH
jgi:NAD(P)H dehydrogenase (quinone)